MSIKRSSKLSTNTFGIYNSSDKENILNNNVNRKENAGYHLIEISRRMLTRIILSFCLIFFNAIYFYINSIYQGQASYSVPILVNIVVVLIMIILEFTIIDQLKKAGEALLKAD